MFSCRAVFESSNSGDSSRQSSVCGLTTGPFRHLWIAAIVLSSATTILCVATAAEEPAQPADALNVDQAVQIALANNRNVKIFSLSLDASKEKLAAEKTRRLPSFNTYIFGSQVLQPFSFVVQEGQFGTFAGIGPIPACQHPHHHAGAVYGVHFWHGVAAAAHAL